MACRGYRHLATHPRGEVSKAEDRVQTKTTRLKIEVCLEEG
jgi:hypothetical protein